ncbi:MAG TPA: hypothetical protein ENO00_04860 [Deltaproteobacteria bacterium]|nr:hypothetical protein [Deltaproteobacteria bacterium]
MKREIPTEIKRAVRLLQTSATSDDHLERTRRYEDGIRVLKSCLAGVPGPTEQELIKDLETDYTGKLLEKVPIPVYGNREEVITIWCSYLDLFINHYDEITDNMRKKPNIRNKVNEFFLMVDEEPEILDRLMQRCSRAS